MKPHALLFFSFSLLLIIPACSGSSSPGDSTQPDAGGDARSLPDTGIDDAAPDAPGTCNTLVDSAPAITVEQVAGEPPAPQGGTIVDGTYALTAAVIYTGPGGPTGPSGTAQTTL